MAYKIKSKKSKPAFSVDNIIAYEEGSLSDKDTIQLFQELENSGQAYRLQGHYGRVATAMIGAGIIKPNMRIHSEEEIKRLKQRHQIDQAFSDF
jgi:hypothetical protein